MHAGGMGHFFLLFVVPSFPPLQQSGVFLYCVNGFRKQEKKIGVKKKNKKRWRKID